MAASKNNNTKKIKDYKITTIKKECQVCRKKINEVCSIKVWTTNTTKRYRGSGLAWRNYYSIKLCPVCFKRLEKKLTNLILDK